MFAEINDLRVELRIVPIGLRDGALGVVKDDRSRNAAEMPECVFQNTNEVFGRLSKDSFGVALARMAQNGTKDMSSLNDPSGIRILAPVPKST